MNRRLLNHDPQLSKLFTAYHQARRSAEELFQLRLALARQQNQLMWAKVKAYVKLHADHFLISIGVSVAITIITNVLIHYMAGIMRLLHIPAKLVHLLTGN